MTGAAIFTSIPPRMNRVAGGEQIGPKYLQLCVESWLATDRPVFSFNFAEEIAQLSPRFPGIKFLELPPRPTADALPSVADILNLMHRTHPGICVFLNGDIRLNLPTHAIRFIETHAGDCVLFTNRVDIDGVDSASGNWFHLGIDVFAMPARVAALFDDRGFVLGRPWWDFWLPATALLYGVPVRRLEVPIALHLQHQSVWDGLSHVTFGEKFLASCEALIRATDRRTDAARSFSAHLAQAVADSAEYRPGNDRFAILGQRIAWFFASHQAVPAIHRA